MTYTFPIPTEWHLTISPSQREAAWRASQGLTYARQDSYVNLLCLDAFLNWFRAEYGFPTDAWLSAQEQQAFGGLFSGAALILTQPSACQRILLLPSETSDTEVMEIPQEWIDIPGWAIDYILAVQMDPEGEWLTVWGYATLAAVKAHGVYDGGDRTYSLESPHIQRDLNAFSQILQHCPSAETQVQPMSLPALEAAQAENLIERLGNPELAFPRQAVPFQQWAALLTMPQGRQRLSQRRLGKLASETTLREGLLAPATQLASWFQAAVDESWQTVEALLGPDSLGSLATNLRNETQTAKTVRRAKQLEVHSEQRSQTIVLLIQLNSEAEDRMGVVIQLHPSQGQDHVPVGMQLCLCSPSGKVLQSIQAESQDDYIQLTRFRCPSETRFQVQIKLGETVVVEPFVA